MSSDNSKGIADEMHDETQKLPLSSSDNNVGVPAGINSPSSIAVAPGHYLSPTSTLANFPSLPQLLPVGELSAAMFNTVAAYELPGSQDLLMFGGTKRLPQEKVEVTCREIFVAVLDQVVNGYRGNYLRSLTDTERKDLVAVDHGCSCFERVMNVVTALKNSERLCHDVYDNPSLVLDLVRAPLVVDVLYKELSIAMVVHIYHCTLIRISGLTLVQTHRSSSRAADHTMPITRTHALASVGFTDTGMVVANDTLADQHSSVLSAFCKSARPIPEVSSLACNSMPSVPNQLPQTKERKRRRRDDPSNVALESAPKRAHLISAAFNLPADLVRTMYAPLPPGLITKGYNKFETKREEEETRRNEYHKKKRATEKTKRVRQDLP
ncbi:hypothetical protein BDV96DRAFT_594312 [Lophiotrema nucula]|uniref:Uncharacterized protein n=1 Tax=Lophiotrema nucula TaxID=690887 RepID=A0A6A5ZN09_9PLEO|nr:hypothetical protein BDV96DRAFT_594312 [Lophiotrema nucula]